MNQEQNQSSSLLRVVHTLHGIHFSPYGLTHGRHRSLAWRTPVEQPELEHNLDPAATL